jgi:hypothetical protein
MSGPDSSCGRARDDFDRLQFRRADALRFRLQREINLKDDEVSRLMTELALIRGRAETVSDKVAQSKKPFESQCASLKRKLFEARSGYDLKRTKIETEHQARLRELESSHDSEMKQLQSHFQAIALDANRPAPVDEVDAFLDSVRPVQNKLRKNGQLVGDDLNRLKQLNQMAEERIENLKADLSAALRKSKTLPNSEPAPIVAGDDVPLKKLEAKRVAEKERSAEITRAIAAARQDAVVMAKKAQSQPAAKKKFRDSEMIARLAAMTPTQKQAQIDTLRAENDRLKREIARVDFMIYGRAGKYQQWKQI